MRGMSPEGDPKQSISDRTQPMSMVVSEHERNRVISLLVFVAVVAVTAYPPLATLAEQGVLGAFRYLAADSFYYLSVAEHSADLPFFTFDGIHPTNGFHPLWQLVLERSFRWLGLNSPQQIAYVAVMSVALVSLGTGLFALAVLRLTRRPALALLASAPGIYYLLMPGFNPHVGSQWSFANGMETPLSVCFFGILLYALVNREVLTPRSDTRRLLLVSVLLTLLTVSRLDDIFLFAPFLLYVAFSSGDIRQAVRRVAVSSVVPFVALGGYLIYNLTSAGSLLPSSGATKVEPLWAFARNVYALLTTTAPFADPLGRENPAWSHEAWRMTQMVVPALAAAWWLLTRPMRLGPETHSREGWHNTLVGLLAAYTLLKCGYNFSMVSLWHQGQWYYPLCIMTFNLIAATGCAQLMDARSKRRQAPTLGTRLAGRWPVFGRLPVASAAALALVVISANGMVDVKRHTDRQSRAFDFWTERTSTQSLLESNCPGCGVLAFDDGIVSYSLQNTPTLNGLGLSMDAEARAALREGRLLEMAWRRGHRLFVSVSYEMPAEAYSSRPALRAHLQRNRHFTGQNLEEWDFEVAFRSAKTQVSFIRFQPRPGTHAARMLKEPGVPKQARGTPLAPVTPLTPSVRDEQARHATPPTDEGQTSLG